MRRERIVLLFWLFLSIFVSIESYRLGLGTFNAPGPGFLNFAVSLFLIISVVFLLLKREEKSIEKAAPLFRGKKVKNAIFVLFILFAYSLLLDELGFVVSTMLFMVFCLKIFGPHRWRVVLMLSISVTIFSYVLFVLWLQIQIPEGRWVEQLFH